MQSSSLFKSALTLSGSTESTTSSAQLLKQNQAVVKSYNDVVNGAKLSNSLPSFTKATYRGLSWDFWGKIWFGDVAGNNPSYFVSEADAKAAPIVIGKGTANAELCIPNNLYASLLDDTDADAVSAAVKSATREDLGNGTAKIVIVLNEEANPAPIGINDKTAENFTSKMFPVITADGFRALMDNDDVEGTGITYKDCTVELVYEISSGEIISLKQMVTYVADVEMGFIKAAGTVSETSEYTNFIY